MSFFVAAALFGSVAMAQQKPVFGVKAGLNVSDLKVQGVNNAYDTKLGLHFGGLAHLHLSRQIAFQPEIQFSAQGGEINNTNNDLKLNYINVPLMVQYMFDNGFRLEAGPQLGFMVNAEQEGVAGDIGDRFKKVDLGLGIGLNYLSYSGLGVGGRYNLGLSNINETTPDVMNRVFQASVFYMFDHDHKAKSR